MFKVFGILFEVIPYACCYWIIYKSKDKIFIRFLKNIIIIILILEFWFDIKFFDWDNYWVDG